MDKSAVRRDGEGWDMRVVRGYLVGLALLTCATIQPARTTYAQTPDTTVYTVSYIEVAPASTRGAIAVLKQYREASLAEDGHLTLNLLEQVDRQGRFVLLEAWKDQASYDAHGASASAKTLVEKLQPFRISPVDQRLYRGLSVVSKSGDPTRQTVYVVTHVDTIPAPGGDGPGLLRRLAEESRNDEGNLRFDVWQHAMRANHFTVIEAWRDQKALDAHAAATHTKQYRETLYPLTGSPLDERIYKTIE